MKKIIIVLAIFGSLLLPAVTSFNHVHAVDGFEACKNAKGDAATGAICSDQEGQDLQLTAKNLINVGLWIVGVASVIVIIVSGIYYVISAGNADTVKKAKNALVYAVVGLVVALLSYTIVNYVVNIF
jgi:cytochrome bd-type quinol oxidase subunit 2